MREAVTPKNDEGRVRSDHVVPIRAILFDKDGTLVDFQRTWAPAVEGVLQHLARGDNALYRRLAAVSGLVDGARFLSDSPLIEESTDVFAARWAWVLGRGADARFFGEIDRLLCEATTAHLAPIGDPAAVFGKLVNRGYRLGVITNDAEATGRAHAHKLGLDHMLAFVAGYDSGFGAKPAAGAVFAFSAAVGVAASEIALVGDTALDVTTARTAGSRAVVVLTGPASSELQQVKADAVIASIDELPAWLDSQQSESSPPG
jgi:phosphoglycolate phosphatase